MAGGGEDHIGVVADLVGGQARIIDGDDIQLAAAMGQLIAQGIVTGVLNRSLAVAVQQQFRGQPQRVLRPKGDQDLFGAGKDAAPGQGMARDIFEQKRVVLIEVIAGHGGKVFLPQCPQRTEPPVGVVKQGLVRLPIDEWIAIAAPVPAACGGYPRR